MTTRDWAKFAVGAILEDSNHVVVVIDTDMVIRWASPSILQYGFDPVGQSIGELVLEEDIERLAAVFTLVDDLEFAGPSALSNVIVPISTVTPIGIIPIHASGRWVKDRSDDTWWLVTILHDVRSRAAIDQALKMLASGASEDEMLRAIIAAARGIGGVDGAQLVWSRAGGRMRTWGDLGSSVSDVDLLIGLEGALEVRSVELDNSSWAFALPISSVDELLGTLTVWGVGPTPGADFVALALEPLVDISALALERADRQAELERRATTDLLTGVLNRHGFFGELEGASPHTAVMYVDLDEFKAVNDAYGHTVGDRLLSVVAKRLGDAVREQDIVSRVGGDEFAVLCRAVTEVESQLVADRVVESLNQTFSIEGKRIGTGASVGVAFSRDAIDGRVMLDKADQALMQAKTAGKGRSVVLIIDLETLATAD